MASLDVKVVDVYGVPVRDEATVVLAHRSFQSERRHVKGVRLRGRGVKVTGLRDHPVGLYELTVRPRSYRPASVFVSVGPNTGDVVVPVLVRPYRVVPVWAEVGSGLDRVLRRVGVDLDRLGPLERACVLNVAAKSYGVAFGEVGLIEHTRVVRVQRDRVLAEVPSRLYGQVSRSARFREVGSALHEPPEGYAHAGSYKTLERVANLQVTFFSKVGGPMMADIDIDNHAGLRHVADVVKHHVSGEGTHPYDIHDLLVRWQGIDPGYRLVPRGDA